MKNAIFFLVIFGLLAMAFAVPVVEPTDNHAAHTGDREGRFFFGRMFGYGYPYYGGYGGYGGYYGGYGRYGYGGYGYPYYWG